MSFFSSSRRDENPTDFKNGDSLRARANISIENHEATLKLSSAARPRDPRLVDCAIAIASLPAAADFAELISKFVLPTSPACSIASRKH